jgi:hypothetical protein
MEEMRDPLGGENCSQQGACFSVKIRRTLKDVAGLNENSRKTVTKSQ